MGQHDLIKGAPDAGDNWFTPDWLYRWASDRWGPFDLDPAASDSNHKCELYYTKVMDGLALGWSPHRVWCNPPYGRGTGRWVARGYESMLAGSPIVVMLLPVRTSASWWHEYVLYGRAEVVYLRGRVVFGGARHGAGFGSAVVVYRPGLAKTVHRGEDVAILRRRYDNQEEIQWR